MVGGVSAEIEGSALDVPVKGLRILDALLSSEDRLGMSRREHAAMVGRTRLYQDGVSLRRTRRGERAGDFQMGDRRCSDDGCGSCPRTVRPLGRARPRRRPMSPTALRPPRRRLPRVRTAARRRDSRSTRNSLRRRGGVGGDDVPRGTAARQMVECREGSGELPRVGVGGGGRRDESDAFGPAGDGRQRY